MLSHAGGTPGASSSGPRRQPPSVEGIFGAEVTRARHDDENIGNIELEEFIVSAVDMEAIANDRDHETMKDSAWMWDEPVLTYQATITDKELLVARSEEVDNLNQFKVLKFVTAETFANTPGAIWIGSRWEDGRKDSGCLRSRWVLQEFATKKVHGEFFSPTPDALEVELSGAHPPACT